MKKYQVDFWGQSPFEYAPRWHKLGTYDLETALKVAFDPDTFRLTASEKLCVVDMETGEVVADNEFDPYKTAVDHLGNPIR